MTDPDADFEQHLRAALREASVPGELRIRPNVVVAEGNSRLRKRQHLVRRAVCAVAAAAALLAFGLPVLHHSTSPASSSAAQTGEAAAANAASCAGPQVPDAGGVQRLLVFTADPTVTLFATADCERGGSDTIGTVALRTPAAGAVSAGKVAGMPVYVVRGHATATALRIAGGTVSALALWDGHDRTIVWPDQMALRRLNTAPTAIDWTEAGIRHTASLGG